MELLIGSGNSKDRRVGVPGMPEGWTELVTLDIDPGVKPDVVHDLNDLPLPFDDDMFDEIHAYEVLEHTGQQGDWRFFFNQFYELWRIMKPNAYLCCAVPAWDSKWAWGDPGHTRIISEASLAFLNQNEYKLQIGKTAMTDYREWWKGDFDLVAMKYQEEGLGFVLQAIKPARL